MDGKVGVCCEKRGQTFGYRMRDAGEGCEPNQVLTGLHFDVSLGYFILPCKVNVYCLKSAVLNLICHFSSADNFGV